MDNHVYKVLCVDDDLGVFSVLWSAFHTYQPGKWDLTHILDVDAAVRAFDTDTYDLAIVDLNIIGSHGLQTLTTLLGHNMKKMPIVVMDGGNITEDGLQGACLKLGAAAFFNKKATEFDRAFVESVEDFIKEKWETKNTVDTITDIGRVLTGEKESVS
jgi:DNA-binding NtrC family response regulator